MNVKVDQDTCVGCGMCAGIASEVFELKEGKAHVIEGADLESNKDMIEQAASSCPVQAIEIE